MGNCSSSGACPALRDTFRCGAVLQGIIVAATLALGSHPVLADGVSEVDDAAARAEYAFYTGDQRALGEVVAELEVLEVPASHAAMKQYYLAFSHWKRAQLYAAQLRSARENGGSKGEARSAALTASQACAQHARSATAADPGFAEAFAIEAACNGVAQSVRPAAARVVGGSCARGKPLRTALELAPDNPRVRLIEYLCLAEDEPDAPGTVQKLRAVVAAFEAAPVPRPGLPDWGEAEALVSLGESCLRDGDSRTSRDALERALVLAPDYRRAQELLRGPR